MAKVAVIDGVRLQDEGELKFPFFSIKNGLLYWTRKRRGVEYELLLMPRSYRDTVMHLAHSHVLGGHLGRDKTEE